MTKLKLAFQTFYIYRVEHVKKSCILAKNVIFTSSLIFGSVKDELKKLGDTLHTSVQVFRGLRRNNLLEPKSTLEPLFFSKMQLTVYMYLMYLISIYVPYVPYLHICCSFSCMLRKYPTIFVNGCSLVLFID